MSPFRHHVLSAVTLVFAGFAIYYRGLAGPFLFDDLSNILQVPAIALTHLDLERLLGVVRNEDGEWLRRPLARLSFAFNYYQAGFQFDPFVYKLTNLVVHCVCGVLMYILVYQLVRFRDQEISTLVVPTPPVLFAFVVASFWLIHPIQLTSVLYVVQRMTSLSAMFVLAGLVLFTVGRQKLSAGCKGAWRLIVSGIVIGILLGGSCKEIAILTPFFALAIDWFFFDPKKLRVHERRKLVLVYGVAMAMFVGLACYWLWSGFDLVVSIYSIREFNPVERMLTQSRVLFFYLYLILFPAPRSFGLFHDDMSLSAGLFEPVTTAMSVLAWFGILVATFRGAMRRQLWAFGIVWYLIGHSIESTLLGLELIHEHRNYLPSFGVVFSLVWVVWCYFPILVRSKTLRMACVVLLAATLLLVTWSRVGDWSDRLVLAQSWVKNHPDSYRSLESLAFAYRERGESITLVYDTYNRASDKDRTQVLPLVEMAKMLQALILSTLDMPSQHVGQVSITTAPLTFDRHWLAAAVAALDAEIERRLREHSLSPGTLIALFNLFVCEQEGDIVCRSLSSANLRWHRIANANSRVNDFDSKRLRLTLQALESENRASDTMLEMKN